MMSSQLHIWYWDVRFFSGRSRKRNFLCGLSPAGKCCGYTHKIEEARAGATLERAAAQAEAQDFPDFATWN